MDKRLRVLVVLPMYGGSLPVGRFCAQGLRECGHLVEVFEAPDFHPSYRALEDLKVTTDRLDYLQNSYLQVVSQAILAKVETFEPDLVLCMAQAPMSIQALKRLRRDKVATAMWFVEDYRLFTYWKAYAPYYDVFAVIQREGIMEGLQEIGQQNGVYLPLAAQPDFHQPLDMSDVDRRKFGAEISFMGAGYPNRRMAFRELIRPGFKLWGTEWDGDHVLEPYLQMEGRRVTPEECVKIFNGSAINLNLHSSVQAKTLVTHGDFINPRTFEVAACGAFQLVDRRTLMPEAFAEDELAVFDSMGELKDKIEYYLAHPDERQAIAQRGRARVLADHTYANRMRTLLDFVEQRLDNWPPERERSDLYPEGFPEELKGELKGLLAELSLPEDATFEDLCWAIRSRQGELSGLDTAILFLEEWRKLYK